HGATRGIVGGAVVDLIALQATVAAEVVPVRGEDHILVLQLRVGPRQQPDDVARGDVAQHIGDVKRGLGPQAKRFEVGLGGGGLGRIVVFAGGREEFARGVHRQPALHGDVAGVAVGGADLKVFATAAANDDGKRIGGGGSLVDDQAGDGAFFCGDLVLVSP